jgi:hypothetical protein
MKIHKIFNLLVLLTLSVILIARCGGGGSTSSGGGGVTGITISPATALVALSGTKNFTAADQDGNNVTGSVTWAVTDDYGSISLNDDESAAVYIAPDSAPESNPVTITATSGDVSGSAEVGINYVTLTDAAEISVEPTDSTGVYPNTFDVTFPVAMDDTSVTTAENITMSCSDDFDSPIFTLNPTISVATSESAERTYTITVTDGWRYALMKCTVTFTTNITDSNANALPDAQAYKFTNACAVNDDFNANTISDDSSSCWQISTGGIYATWASMNGVLTLNTANSTLDADFTGLGNKNITFYKELTLEEDFEIVIKFKSASGIIGNFRLIVTGVGDTLAFDNNRYLVGMVGYTDEQHCTILGAGDDPRLMSTECNTDQIYYVKFARSGGEYTSQYKLENGAYEDLPLFGDDNAWPTISAGTAYLAIIYSSTGDDKANIDYITIDGATVTGQY